MHFKVKFFEWLTEKIKTEDDERCLASLRLTYSV